MRYRREEPSSRTKRGEARSKGARSIPALGDRFGTPSADRLRGGALQTCGLEEIAPRLSQPAPRWVLEVTSDLVALSRGPRGRTSTEPARAMFGARDDELSPRARKTAKE